MAYRTGLFAFCAAICALPSVAHASNGIHPRTPVQWTDVPCKTVVDRSVDPVLQFDYSIPYEDTDTTADEVADSRTHQFLAFCRDKDPQTVLPEWVAWADVDAAGMKPLDIDPSKVDDNNVLDTSTDWMDCFTRITADADRRPITEAEAAMPVVWDTTGLAAGPWIVYGYTYEPAFNIWVRRPGIVQIVDDPALDATGPGLAISSGEQILYKGEEATLEGCVAAMDGSTMDAYWSEASDTTNWVPFLEAEPVMGESVSLPFLPPDEEAGKSMMIRVDVTDPMGRSYTAYMPELVMVLKQSDPSDCGDSGGSFVGNPGCGSADGTGGSGGTSGAGGDSGGAGGTGGAVTSGGGGTGGAATTAQADGGDGNVGGGGGGACSVDPRHAPIPLFVIGLFALGLRRRE